MIKKTGINSGQSLIEILIAIGVGAVLIGGATVVIVPILRSNLETRDVQIATFLAQEYLDNVQSISESDWQNIYDPPGSKGPSSQFYLSPSGSSFELVSGASSTVIEGKTFTRYFSIENVNRDLCGTGDVTTDSPTACLAGPGTAGVADDPSTQKVTATVNWPDNRSITKIQHFTRSGSEVLVQTDWSGGPGEDGPFTLPTNEFDNSDNIDYSGTPGSIKIEGI